MSRRLKLAVRSKRPKGEAITLPQSIGSFIAQRTSGRWANPLHLGDLCSLIESAHERPFKAIVSIPPQSGKTETILHGLALLIAKDPWRTNGYASYATELSRSKSEKCRTYALDLDVAINPRSNRLEEWRTPDGGGLLATGVGGPLTGQGIDGVLVVDDPVKNREQADSPTYRRKTRAWFDTVATTRMHPQSSTILCMTRWNKHDIAGELEAEGWADVVIRLPAVTGHTGFDPGLRGPDGGWERRPFFEGSPVALWPQGRSLDFLAEQRRSMGPHEFGALYQQDPQPREGAIFDPPALCNMSDIPGMGRDAIGVDLAYSEKSYADYTAFVVLRRVKDIYYVVHAERRRQRAPESVAMFQSAVTRWPGAPMVWHAAGTEKGSSDLMVNAGVPLQTRPILADKLHRALPLAAVWNAGDVVVPRDARWAPDFLREVADFTGSSGDLNDDQVDCLATAFAEICGNGIAVESSGDRSMRSARSAY